jgi:hypothetical protein
MESGVAAFLKRALKRDPKAYRIVNSKDTPFFGKSKAQVYFIQNKCGVTRYVVKVFQHPTKVDNRFMLELSSMASILKRKLINADCVMPLAVGQFWSGDKQYGLLLETVARGQRGDQYILALRDRKAIVLRSLRDSRQTEQFDVARRMMQALGRALAEVHGIDALKWARGAKAIEKAVGLSGRRIYKHGDAGVRNFFYDDETESLTLIDIGSMHESIGRRGEPLATKTKDLSRVKKSVEQLARRAKLAPEEVETLLTAFYEGYCKY